MEENKVTIEAMLYRMRRLDEKYEKIKWLVSGAENSYIEPILNGKGNVSRDALDRMIGELVECMEVYRSYKAAQEKGFGVKMEPYHLPCEEDVFYRSYFYLLIGLALEQDSGPMTWWCRPGTWDALIERVDGEIYKTTAEIDRDLINAAELDTIALDCTARVPGGLFCDIFHAYWKVMGRPFVADITEQEREAAYRLMTDREVYLLTHPEEMERELNEAQEEYDRFQQRVDDGEFDDLGWADDNASLDDDFYEEMADMMPEYYGDAAGGWVKFFGGDRERFDESCRIVRRMYCGIAARSNMKDEVTTAINFHLCRKGVSKWVDDDSFFDVYTYLEKAFNASRKKLGM